MFERSLRGNRLIYAISFASAICFSVFGYDQGVYGGLVGASQFLAYFNNPSVDTISTLGAVYPLGCMLGCIISIFAGVQLGRKRSILLGCIFITVGGAMQASTTTLGQFYAGRVVAGTGTGLTSSAIPMWLSECTQAGTRGRHIAIQMSFVISGVFTAYWIDYGSLKNFPGTQFAWRFPLAFQCAYAIIGFILVSALPESPRLLYAQGRLEEADAITLRILDCKPDDMKFRLHRQSVLDNLAAEHSEEGDSQPLWKALVWDSSPLNNSRRFWICMVMQGLQQLGGINAVAYYEYTILHDSIGLAPNTASLLAGVAITFFLIGSFGGIYIVEAWGRRTSLLVGSFLTTMSMLALTICLSFVPNKTAGWAAYGFIIIYQMAFAIGWLSVPWIYAPEISPLRYRHANTSAAVASEWLFTFVTVKVLPVGIANLGWRIYIVWTVFNAVQFVFTWIWVPETRGKTLEEIDYMFSGFAGDTISTIDKQEVSHLE